MDDLETFDWREVDFALEAEAMTQEPQPPAASRDGFVTYDELRGPDLDAARWSPARLPLPTGGEHIPLDPQRGAGRRRGRGASDDPALLAVAPDVPVRRRPNTSPS